MDYELRIDLLKKMMEEKGLTNEDVAALLRVKMSTMRRYLKGSGHPDFTHLYILSRKLNFYPFDLMILDKEEIKKIRDARANKSK